jgi:hypothetical protein
MRWVVRSVEVLGWDVHSWMDGHAEILQSITSRIPVRVSSKGEDGVTVHFRS